MHCLLQYYNNIQKNKTISFYLTLEFLSIYTYHVCGQIQINHEPDFNIYKYLKDTSYRGSSRTMTVSPTHTMYPLQAYKHYYIHTYRLQQYYILFSL